MTDSDLESNLKYKEQQIFLSAYETMDPKIKNRSEMRKILNYRMEIFAPGRVIDTCIKYERNMSISCMMAGCINEALVD